nr:MAG TPA: hypothetical protein [Caudoviricetes sp.]
MVDIYRVLPQFREIAFVLRDFACKSLACEWILLAFRKGNSQKQPKTKNNA